jgi:acyl-CoA synthetase (AMP-forming)/AMP-acid ligase II
MPALSPTFGATTLDEAFRRVVAQTPEAEAIVAGDFTATYGDVARLVEACAAALAAQGVAKGDRVAILSPPRPEVLIVLLACARLGAIYLGLGTRLTRGDLEYVLADARPSLIFCVASFDGRAFGADAAAACETVGLAPARLLTIDGSGRLAPEFAAFLDGGARLRPSAPAATPPDPLAIIYTSGTTGPPKGTVISHRGILTAVAGVLPRIDVARFRALCVLPIDHVAFLANEAVKVILCGGTAIQLARFEPGDVLDAIQRHRATYWFAIPTMLQRLVTSGKFDDYDLSSLQLVSWAGPMARPVLNALRRKSPRLGVSYGMTEASGGITYSEPEDDDEALLDTVGRPHDAVEVRLDDQVGIGPEEAREILIRGPQLMLGYWNKPAETAKAFADGWFKTGDLGVLRDGRLCIVGRLKELIRTGGYNVSPTEVERVIEACPGVGMVVVLGVPDERYGEAVHAVWSPVRDIILADVDLEQHVRRHLAGYKVPKRFWRRGELPFLANGKLDRKELRRQIAAAMASS